MSNMVEAPDIDGPRTVSVPLSLVQNRKLSLAAKGAWPVIGLAVVKSGGPLNMTVDALAELAGCGRQAMTTVLRELETAGYLVRTQSRTAGRFNTTLELGFGPETPA